MNKMGAWPGSFNERYIYKSMPFWTCLQNSKTAAEAPRLTRSNHGKCLVQSQNHANQDKNNQWLGNEKEQLCLS